MKKGSESTKATVKDFSNGKDGSQEIDVNYSYEFDILENQNELAQEFAPADLLSLANQRLKATANSKARQEAIKQYAQDPNSPAAVRERMIKDAVKLGKSVEQATAFVDSLLAA